MCFIRSCHLHNKQRQNSSFIKNVGRHKNRFSCCLSSWRQQETFRVAIFWWRLERFFAVSSSSSFWLLMFSLFGVLRFGERRVTCWEYFSGGELYRDYFLSAASKYIYPRNLICLELNSVHLLYSFLIFSHAVLGTRSPTSWVEHNFVKFVSCRKANARFIQHKLHADEICFTQLHSDFKFIRLRKIGVPFILPSSNLCIISVIWFVWVAVL